MKRIVYIAIFTLLSLTQVRAQESYSNRALESYQNSDWKKAMTLIDSAILVDAEKNDPFTWHLRGFIYKDYFRQVEKEIRTSPNRQVAIESFKKSNELDKTGDFKSKNFGMINYLIVSYYNDAVRLMDTTNYVHAEKTYKRFKAELINVYPDTSVVKKDVEFYNALATIIVKKYNRMDSKSEEFFNTAITVYEKVIDLDSNNCLAHYMIGLLYYNKGVDIILDMDETTPIDVIMQKQDQCLELFLKSKPHMYKAWELQDCKAIDPVEILEGLSGIHYQLNEVDKYKYWLDLKSKMQQGKRDDK